LNSGAIYRAVTLAVMESGGQFEDRQGVKDTIAAVNLETGSRDGQTRFFLNGRDVTGRIKDPDVTAEVYRVANDGEYRKLLVSLQRDAVGERGIVAEGRDMGTVIFPDARVKVFLDASLETRARRQHQELLNRGVESIYEEVLEKSRERDQHDTGRTEAPLRAASDAIVVDSGDLSAAQVLEAIVSRFGEVLDPPAGEGETTA
jgi:cytidylate kinase